MKQLETDVPFAVNCTNCGQVDIRVNHHHYAAGDGPIFAAMQETITRLEAKIDELAAMVRKGGKKGKK